MISEDKFYEVYREYEEVITGMNEKLLNFKAKNPHSDISDSLETINKLRHLHDCWHKVYHDNVSLNGIKSKLAEEKFRLASEWAQREITLQARIKFLESENIMLKKDIAINPNL